MTFNTTILTLFCINNEKKKIINENNDILHISLTLNLPTQESKAYISTYLQLLDLLSFCAPSSRIIFLLTLLSYFSPTKERWVTSE